MGQDMNVQDWERKQCSLPLVSQGGGSRNRFFVAARASRNSCNSTPHFIPSMSRRYILLWYDHQNYVCKPHVIEIVLPEIRCAWWYKVLEPLLESELDVTVRLHQSHASASNLAMASSPFLSSSSNPLTWAQSMSMTLTHCVFPN